jgi:hypothetical protein
MYCVGAGPNDCTEPDCQCHRLAAAPLDLEALACQQEEARSVSPGAFGVARCAFLGGVREAVAQARELVS